MEVFGNRVLVEQKKTIKVSNIILPGGKNAENETMVTFKVIGKGKKVEEIEIGDIPIFGKHVIFHGVKVVEKSETSETLHVIVYDEDILGADDAPVQEVIEKESETKIEE